MAERAWRQLRQLTELLNRQESPADDDLDQSLETELQRQEAELLGAPGVDPATPGIPPELKSARHFRAGLVRLHSDRLVEESLQNARPDSGPLNPEKLVVHSLALMRDLSPAYLDRYVSYVDTLFTLGQAAEPAATGRKKP